MSDVVTCDIAVAMINARSENQPRQIDRQTAEKALSDALQVSDPILRSRLVLAGLRATPVRLAPDFAPQAFADGILALLEARNTPASPPLPPTNQGNEQ